jgi:hypothetical protein
MSKHREPWYAGRLRDGVCDLFEKEHYGCPSVVAEDVDSERAARIVECVNEMRGLNPAAVRELVEACEAAESADSKYAAAVAMYGEDSAEAEVLDDERTDVAARYATALAKVREL